jgi:hypothetical protein
MNAQQRRIEKRKRIARVDWLVKTDPLNYGAIYKAIRSLRFEDLVVLGVTKIELRPNV